MKFLLVREQSGGCDYTINCGLDVSVIVAESMAAALEQVRQTVVGIDSDDDWRLRRDKYGENCSEAQLYAVTEWQELPLDTWHAEWERADSAAAATAQKNEELAELERLQRKYGKS